LVAWRLLLNLRMLELRNDHVGVVDPKLQTLRRDCWRPLEEHWTYLVEHSTLDPCLLDILTLELVLCHLELQQFTCGPIYCLVILLVVEYVHLLLLTSLTFHTNKGGKESFHNI
jgi:hypothetical protein